MLEQSVLARTTIRPVGRVARLAGQKVNGGGNKTKHAETNNKQRTVHGTLLSQGLEDKRDRRPWVPKLLGLPFDPS